MFSILTDSHFAKEIGAFFKSIGWSWLLFTPLFLMNINAPDHEKRKTVSRFVVQVVGAMTVTIICSAFVFYIGTTAFTTKMTVEIKIIKDSLTLIQNTLNDQAKINSKNDIEFLTHKHNRKDGNVRLRGE